MIRFQDITKIMDEVFRESPDPFNDDAFYNTLKGIKVSYRDRLDRQPKNMFGELIPRIVTVRKNLRQLKKPSKKPNLPN